MHLSFCFGEHMFVKLLLGIILGCGFGMNFSYAETPLLEKPEVQHFIQEMVQKNHFSKSEVVAILSQAEFKPEIIQKITFPYEGKPWDVYRPIFLNAQKIDGGVDFWRAHRAVLNQAEKKYGIPAEYIVAILGVETIYGRQQGTFRVFDALTTLAFYFPKRAPYFQYELKEYLLMCKEHHIQPTSLLGSYAGAMGMSQFMPSSYRKWAVSYNGHAAPDIAHNPNDAIFSIANYLQKHGWSHREKVTQLAYYSHPKCDNLVTNTKKPIYHYRYLTQCGVKPAEKTWSHPSTAGLLEMTTAAGPEYWIGYPNFYVILTYNSSPLYGLAVYQLGQTIAKKV